MLPALHQAASSVNIKKLRSLLKAGADVNEKEEENGLTPLHYACFSNNLAAAGVLIQFHADTSLLTHEGRSCLHLASRKGGPDLVKLLLDHGATDIINTTDNLRESPLLFACTFGTADTVRLLLDAGADPKLLDVDGWSPLHKSSYHGKSDSVRLLLEQVGVEVNSCENLGMTPIHLASSQGHNTVVRMLIDAGANVNKFNKDHMFPLYLASQEGFVEVVKELIAAGAHLDSFNSSGNTSLHIASTEGHLEVVLELLSAGAEVRSCNTLGFPALYYAVKEGKSAVVRELLKAGADANHAGGEECVTALMRAESVPIVRLLLDAGANPNAADAGGHNALHYAGTRESSAAVMCSLFKGGCDPRARSNDGSPADVARGVGKEDAARLLDRLAEEAESAANRSSVVLVQGNDNRETEDRKPKEEQEVDRLVVGVEDHEEVPSRPSGKVVKPCANCGAITHRKCSGCIVTHYCSRECQCAAYKQHKGECAALCEEKMEAKARRAAARAGVQKISSEEG